MTPPPVWRPPGRVGRYPGSCGPTRSSAFSLCPTRRPWACATGRCWSSCTPAERGSAKRSAWRTPHLTWTPDRSDCWARAARNASSHSAGRCVTPWCAGCAVAARHWSGHRRVSCSAMDRVDTCNNGRSDGSSSGERLPRAWRGSRRTPCGTPTLRTCWKVAPTCAASRSCWVTPRLRRRRSTPTSRGSSCARPMNTRIHAHEGVPNALARTSHGAGADDIVRALWRRWVAERGPADRERLILHYAPLVKYVAGRLSVGISSTVDLGDLISYGILGLIDAIERYDPERGPRFESYALERIKGTIIDELRAVDWVPRAVREHARAVQAALAELEVRLRRTPTDEGLAAHMGITVLRLRKLLDEISLTSLIALDELFVDSDGRHRALA